MDWPWRPTSWDARPATPAVKEKAQYMQTVCQQSTQEIREMIQELRTETPETGIATEMSRMVTEWSQATGIKAEFAASGDDRILPLLASHHLRSVLSEALENIRKHAQASQADVTLELLPGRGTPGDCRRRQGNPLRTGRSVFARCPKGTSGCAE